MRSKEDYMRAVKANKQYVISEFEKNRYIAEGYDITDDDGNILAYGKGKSVPYEKYKKVLDELNALKENPLKKVKVAKEV